MAKLEQERTTEEVIRTLGDDCSRCHQALLESIRRGNAVDTDFEFHARQLIRAIFAYIEAVTFSVKATSAGLCMQRGLPISATERYLATDTEYELDDKGKVFERSAKISLTRNVRFSISLFERVYKVSKPFNPAEGWWSDFRASIRVRDRLTHPKLPGDLDISSDEVISALRAKLGIEEYFLQKKWLRRKGRGLFFEAP